MKPNRSEVWLFDLGMEGKVRPALIISADYDDSDRALITILPHTTSLRGSQYEIPVTLPFLKPGAFLVQECCNLSEGESRAEARSAEKGSV
jgi:mRNA interferase MazF